MARAMVGMLVGLLVATAGFSQPYGSGPGTMGGHHGQWGPGAYGMGPGMMGGGCVGGMGMGMGSGMMWGYGPGGPDFSSEQRSKLADIQKEFSRKQWALMEKMHDSGWHMGDVYREGKFDEQAARKAYDTMAEMRKQMFENSLEMCKRLDGVLTPQQREQLRRAWGGK